MASTSLLCRSAVLAGVALTIALTSAIAWGQDLAEFESGLLPPFSGSAVKTISPEEDAYLDQEEERQMFVLLRQSAYPGIVDQVTSYPAYEPDDGANCPFDREYIENTIRMDRVKLLPEVCYYSYTSYLHYPQNTGSAQADQEIKNDFGGKPVHSLYEGALLTYVIGRPSPPYISIAFCSQGLYLGNRDYQLWFVRSYNVETSRALTLEDVFPDMNYSQVPLEIYLYKRLWPGGEDITGPEDYPGLRKYHPIDMNIERLLLAEDGLHVIFNLYEQGAYGDGLKFVHIPLTDLPDLGANMALWGK